MADTTELEYRLSSALDRLRQAAAVQLAARRVAEDRVRELEAMLDQIPQEEGEGTETERATVPSGVIEEKDAAIAALTAEIAALKGHIAARDGGERLGAIQSGDMIETLQSRVSELEAATQSLRQVNAQLRNNNAALREAHLAALPDADLVNDGLKAELEALRATQMADRAEIDSVLTALRPLLEGETTDA